MSDYIDKIPELNSGNYSIWSSRVKAVMILKRCWFAIENHRPAPQINEAQPNDDDQEDNQDPGANVPENLEEIHTWDFANNDAKSIMTLTITSADNEKIKRLATAKQAWDKLKSDYTRSNSLEKTKLLGKISVIKFESSVPLAKHLDGMIAMFDRLQDLGEDMSEIFKVNFLLESLKHDSRFRNIITNIRMWEENNKTVSRVRNELIAQMEDIVQVHERNSGNKMRQSQGGEINNNALLAWSVATAEKLDISSETVQGRRSLTLKETRRTARKMINLVDHRDSTTNLIKIGTLIQVPMCTSVTQTLSLIL
jgi:hypothetical protein